MNINPIDPSFVLCKILLAFPKEYIFIANNEDIIELLKLYTNKPPYISFLSRIPFQRNGSKLNCPALENTLEEMKGFMLILDENIPNKYAINKTEIQDFVSKFSTAEILDEMIVRKLAKELEMKINSKHDYKTITNANKLKRDILPDNPKIENIEEIADSISQESINNLTQAFKSNPSDNLGIFGDVNLEKNSISNLLEDI